MRPEAEEAIREAGRYYFELILERRARPRDDMISHLMREPGRSAPGDGHQCRRVGRHTGPGPLTGNPHAIRPVAGAETPFAVFTRIR
jgi:hypothetical protein